jgi:hypothetical protein
MSEAIRRATAVGNAEAVRDLQLTLRHLRACPVALPSASQATGTDTPSLVSSEMMIALRLA